MEKCKLCDRPLKRGNKSGYCRQCYKPTRCELCGKIVGELGEHQCASVDLRGERRCEVCGSTLGNTGWQRWSKICRRCSKQRWRVIEKEKRRVLREQFGGKCSRCGYDKCEAALHFHHKDASEKYDWNVKGKTGASIREVEAHPERFELVCVRCHVEIHFLET